MQSSVAAYSVLDQLLHRLALQVGPIAEMSFDLDQRMVDSDPKDIVGERHVFVSGLARAGTTVLMRRFHASGAYRSLTYRDMPFVLAPNLWRKLMRSQRRDVAATERAHGDRIEVDIDSPESLDEVFWRIFAGTEYIAKTHLEPHAPDPETTWKYVCYVNAILHAQDARVPRYLSKNNNNILRLSTIRQAFPQALVLILFRDPVAHAGSLLRQHRNFSKMQADDRFVRSYMTWLAHHEFGHDQRPFRFGDARSSYDRDTIDYWLEMWCATYAWLERSAPKDAIFVCYEDLCSDPKVWSRLAAIAGIAGDGEEGSFRVSTAAADPGSDPELAARAAALYGRLVERARAALQ
jgi:hypothetical protein